jgi:putative transcriptional regulator
MTKIVVIMTRKAVERRENMPLYNRLKEYRARIGVNQQQMGKLAGVSRQTISQIERGDYSPSVMLALKIAKVFDVSVEDIFWYEEDKNYE